MSSKHGAVSTRIQARRRRVKTMMRQHGVVPRQCRSTQENVATQMVQCLHNFVSTRCRVNNMSCRNDCVSPRRRIKTASCQHNQHHVNAMLFQNGAMTTRRPVKMVSCPKRHCVRAAPCQDGVVSRWFRDKAAPHQGDAVSRWCRGKTTPCQDDAESRRRRAKAKS